MRHVYDLDFIAQFEHFKKQLFPDDFSPAQHELMLRCFVAGWNYMNVAGTNNILEPDQDLAIQERIEMNKRLIEFWEEVNANDSVYNLMNEINDNEPT